MALAVASPALAGPGLFVGVAEDGAVWGDPTSQMTLAQQAGFDSVRDFSPIGKVAETANVLVVSPAFAVTSVEQLMSA